MSIPYNNLLMIEDIETQSNNELNVNFNKTKPVFNQYLKPQIESHPASTAMLRIQVKQCRICLQSNESQQNEFVCPCNCIGSVKYIHDKCLRKWIQHKFTQNQGRQRELLLKHGVQCELCKYKIGLSFKNDFLCCKAEAFCRKFKSNPIGFGLFFLFFFIVLTSILYLAYSTSKNGVNFDADIVTGVILVTAFTILGLTELVLIYYCVTDYMVEKQWVLQGFEKRKNRRVRNMQIIPQQIQ